TRTVEDAARMLDIMAGYEPEGPNTPFRVARSPKTYTPFLDRDGLKGSRIGVVMDLFGRDTVPQEVNALTRTAMKKMNESRATMICINVPKLNDLTRNIQVSEYETKVAFNNYLAGLGPRAPVKTLEEFIARGEFHSSLKAGLEVDQRVVDGLNDPEYKNR